MPANQAALAPPTKRVAATLKIPIAVQPQTTHDRFEDVNPEAIVCRGIHGGEPVAKQRPRVGCSASGRHKAFTPLPTKQHQASLRALIEHQVIEKDSPQATYGLRAVFFVKNYQRKDLDNLIKTVLDALNTVAFYDDSQVKELMAWSFVDSVRPRTEFVLYRLGARDRTHRVCAVCGKAFVSVASAVPSFCSRQCWLSTRSAAQEVKCAGCGKSIFKLPQELRANNYCSPQCRRINVNKRCLGCGIIFLAPVGNRQQKFCSKECYGKAKNGHPRKGPL